MMATKGAAPLTEYERLRALNIARNQERMEALGVLSAAEEMNDTIKAGKRARTQQKGLKSSGEKKAKTEPLVIRRSLRAQGLTPEGDSRNGLDGEGGSGKQSPEASKTAEGWWGERETKKPGPMEMRSTNADKDTDSKFIEMLRKVREEQPLKDRGGKRRGGGEAGPEVDGDKQRGGAEVSFDVSKLQLAEGDVAKVVKDRIFSVEFLPLREKVIVAAGDKTGQVGLWDVDAGKEGEEGESSSDGVLAFTPHWKPVSGLVCPPHDCTKLYSCAYDGTVRLMDIDRAVFDELHRSEEDQYSACCLMPPSHSTLYLADSEGGLTVFDSRSKTVMSRQKLHDRKINTVAFNPLQEHLVVTSSTDATVRLWDARLLGSGHKRWPVAKKLLPHDKGVNSAYFSPNGDRLVTTSYDDHVRIWDNATILTGGVNDAVHGLGEPIRIKHNNNTGRWVSSFRATWAWDSTHVFIGGMGRSLDVLSAQPRHLACQLHSEHMTTIPARLALHPLLPIVAGGSASGRLYIWR